MAIINNNPNPPLTDEQRLTQEVKFFKDRTNQLFKMVIKHLEDGATFFWKNKKFTVNRSKKAQQL